MPLMDGEGQCISFVLFCFLLFCFVYALFLRHIGFCLRQMAANGGFVCDKWLFVCDISAFPREGERGSILFFPLLSFPLLYVLFGGKNGANSPQIQDKFVCKKGRQRTRKKFPEKTDFAIDKQVTVCYTVYSVYIQFTHEVNNGHNFEQFI